ncbi:MAG: FAD:protein FMN transferase, partial [Actinobacteria bacterium]|nr:FAD:protein FMN transferase [Actinomycetota bacterium]
MQTTAGHPVMSQGRKYTCALGPGAVTTSTVGRIMGTTCEVRVTGSTVSGSLAAVNTAWESLEDCDRKWSRFKADSELTRINTTVSDAHQPVTLSDLTSALISAMFWARTYSAGWVDASLLPQVIAAGYDRDF